MDLFSYMASCTERGTILPPERVEEGEEFQVVIKEELDKALTQFARNGYFEIGYSILINLPWIVFVSVISQDIGYAS